jgi:hypothetical protein
MEPTRDWAPPSFPVHLFMAGNVVGPHSGPGPASLNGGYGSTHRSIDSGVPFGKGTGLFFAGRQRP